MNIEELQAIRCDLAKIISEFDENTWQYKMLKQALEAIDGQIQTQLEVVKKFEKQINSDSA